MAYRRRHGLGTSATFKEDVYHQQPPEDPSSSSLAAQAIRASAAHRERPIVRGGGPTYDYTSMGSSNEGGSFWGVLARKAKAILDEDNESHPAQYTGGIEQLDVSNQIHNPTLRKGMDTQATSMNRIGDTNGNALEEGHSVVEYMTANFIQETRKLQIRRKEEQNLTSHEDQLKASRDVAMATAAKAKLLLRELKTVKADLAFCKQRCSQLEEENKMLREGREKGVNHADDDMIRCQLETLLEEKGRLAHENSVYARENRFLREIVEYHQLTMQDLVYLDEGIEEVTEYYPVPTVSRTLSISPATSDPPSRTSSVDNATTGMIQAEAVGTHLHPRV